MAALRRGEDALDAGKELRRLEDRGLLDGARLHQPVGIKLRERRRHAVEA